MRLFDVESELVVVGRHGKIIGGSECLHEAVELRWLQTGQSSNQSFVESEAHVSIFFLGEQPLLEGEHALVSPKTKNVDQFLQVETHAHAVLWRDRSDPRFLIVEDFRVIQSVLDGILSVVARTDLYLSQHRHIHLNGDVELKRIGDAGHCELLRAFSQIAEPDGIFRVHAHLIEAVCVGEGA